MFGVVEDGGARADEEMRHLLLVDVFDLISVSVTPGPYFF
jgi:hypothetical protein